MGKTSNSIDSCPQVSVEYALCVWQHSHNLCKLCQYQRDRYRGCVQQANSSFSTASESKLTV